MLQSVVVAGVGVVLLAGACGAGSGEPVAVDEERFVRVLPAGAEVDGVKPRWRGEAGVERGPVLMREASGAPVFPSADLVLYVDGDGPLEGDGLSWETAFRTLQEAIAAGDAAQNGRLTIEIRLGQGVYRPSEGAADIAFDFSDLRAGFDVDGPTLRGGYAGIGAADPNVRNPKVTRSVLSGDFLGNDPALGSTRDPDDPGFDDNARALVFGSEYLDGVVLSRGRVGILEEFPIRARDCVFEGMLGTVVGPEPFEFGASFRESWFERCDFDQNIPEAVINFGPLGFVADDDELLVFERCRFRRNEARASYGVFATTASGPGPYVVFNQCQFVANTTVGSGLQFGAYFGFDATRVRVYNSLFYGNRVPLGDAAGVAGFDGSGFGLVPEDRPVIQNSVFWNNSSEFGDGPNGVVPRSSVLSERWARVIRGSVIEGWDRPSDVVKVVEEFDEVVGVSGMSPMFVDPAGADGVLGTDDDDFRPAPGSPLVDAGLTVTLPGELGVSPVELLPAWESAVDAAGRPRVVEDSFALNADGVLPIDIGPFELQADEVDSDFDGVHDGAQIAADPSLDLDMDGELDSTQRLIDCDGNGVPDSVDLAVGAAIDCDGDGVPDGCQIAADGSLDSDDSGVLDACEALLLFVDDDAAPGGDGSSWSSALSSLDDALDIAEGRSAATEIRVAGGFYLPNEDLGLFSSFQLSDDVTVLGGYAGVGAVDPGLRDPDMFETVLSGDLFGDPSEPVLQVLTARGVRGAVVEGVTVQDGDARGGEPSLTQIFVLGGSDTVLTRGDAGGGLYAVQSELELADVVFRRVTGDVLGSAAGVGGEDSHVLLRDVGFEEIESVNTGQALIGFDLGFVVAQTDAAGVIEIEDSAFEGFGFPVSLLGEVPDLAVSLDGVTMRDPATPVFVQARFVDVDVTRSEIALLVHAGVGGSGRGGVDVSIADSVIGQIEDPSARWAIFNIGNPGEPESVTVSIERSLVFGRFGQGALSIGPSRAFINGSTWVNTSEDAFLRLGLVDADDSLVVQNSVLWRAPGGGPALFGILDQDASIDLRSSLITDVGLLASSVPVDATVFDADPVFVDTVGADGVPFSGDEDYRLGLGSPAIDAGDNTLVPAGVVVDLDGLPRFVDIASVPDTGIGTAPIVDLGAFERQADCLGDATGDGAVTALDISAVLSNFGSTGVSGPSFGDLNGDGDVTALDISIVLSNFGNVCP